MNGPESTPEPNQPEFLKPELLAAYFDGECEGRDELSALKQRIEELVAENPEAQAELASYSALREVWADTTPADPPVPAFEAILANLHDLPKQPVPPVDEPIFLHTSVSRWAAVGIAACLTLGFVFWPRAPRPVPVNLPEFAALPSPSASPSSVAPSASKSGKNSAKRPVSPEGPEGSADLEIFEVAEASEVTILRVEGNDTQTLVVGELPLQGTLELLAPGEVVLTSIEPDQSDNMLPHVQMGDDSTPLIWARTDSEDFNP